MSDIDWSKAPEGATHHVFTGGLDNHHCWYRVRDGGYDFQYSDEMRGWKKGKFQSPASDRLTARPSPSWSGEGLPPVGCECEVLNTDLSNAQWEKCTILFVGVHRILYDSESCSERVGYTDTLQFRPIRTPEQIAADERENFAEGLAREMGKEGSPNSLKQARRMYDLGYRKQEQPK